MIYIVDVDFEPAFPNAIEEARRDRIALFRYDLEGRFDSDGVIQIHEARAEVLSGQAFHIMSKDGAARRALWPEPDKRDSLHTLTLERQRQQPFKDIVYGSIDRPARKSQGLPPPEI